jgi:sugar-phosphatase
MTTGTDQRTRTADALLIDLDGTLVDSHAPILRAWDGWAGRYGVDPGWIRAIMPGRTAASVMREVRPDLPAAVLATDVAALLDQQVADTAEVRPLPGARELLAAVPAGRWAVVTACDDRLARARLRAAGLPEPTVLVSSDTVPTGKPDPAGYLFAAARLAADPTRCLVLEDAPAGVAAGLAAGATVLALPPAADEPGLGTGLLALPPAAGARAGALAGRGDPAGRVLVASGLDRVRVTVEGDLLVVEVGRDGR